MIGARHGIDRQVLHFNTALFAQQRYHVIPAINESINQ